MYRKYHHLNILFLLLLMNIQVGGCGNSSNSENTPGPSSASLWVDINNYVHHWDLLKQLVQDDAQTQVV